jgi:hypothetical protein
VGQGCADDNMTSIFVGLSGADENTISIFVDLNAADENRSPKSSRSRARTFSLPLALFSVLRAAATLPSPRARTPGPPLAAARRTPLAVALPSPPHSPSRAPVRRARPACPRRPSRAPVRPRRARLSTPSVARARRPSTPSSIARARRPSTTPSFPAVSLPVSLLPPLSCAANSSSAPCTPVQRSLLWYSSVRPVPSGWGRDVAAACDLALAS